MDNINAPENQGQPDHAPLEDQVRALKRQIVEQQNQLRDYEKSLVERIADVDDDRRTTVSKLQRAWQTQREEVNTRLGRQTAIVISALALSLLVVGVALFLNYRQVEGERQALSAGLAELKKGLAQLPGESAEVDPLRNELNRLSAAVKELSASSGRQVGEQADSLDTILEDERIARDTADAVIEAEIRRLEADQRDLKRGLEALRDGLTGGNAVNAPEPPLSDGSTTEGIASESQQDVSEAAVTLPGEPSERAPAIAAIDTTETSAVSAEQPVGDTDKETNNLDSGADMPETMIVADRTFALQLIGFYDREALLEFAGRDELPERVYYREETVRKRPWFALIHSLHKDYASASAALNRLPPELIAMDPWIRPIREGVKLEVLSGTNIDNNNSPR